MNLELLEPVFSICQVDALRPEDLQSAFCFAARTDEECSLVCPTECAPSRALTRDDGWRALRVQGVLDFSLVGILAQIAGTLADRGIALFAVSTYNTDYILVRAAQLEAAVAALRGAGHEVAS